MSFELATGTTLQERYVVKKLVKKRATYNQYLARDQKVTDKTILVIEYLIPTLDAAGRTGRHDAYVTALESIQRFEHPGLIRVIDYFTEAGREYVACLNVEGVSLQTMLQMSLGPLTPAQILPWMLQLSSALSYLHSRPRPLVLETLDPSAIILTSDEQVKITSYGLERFFSPDREPETLVQSPGASYVDYVAFGQLLQLLLGGEDRAEAVSPELGQLAQRCLAQRTRPAFHSFDEVTAALQQVAVPKAPSVRGPVPPAVAAAWFPGPEVGLPRPIQALLDWVGRLPVRLLGWLLGGLAVGSLVLLVVLNPTHRFARSGPLVYCVCGEGDVLALDPLTGTVRDRWTLHDAVILDACSIRDGQRLLLLDGHNSRIMVFDTSNDEMRLDVSVDQLPSMLCLDEPHDLLYCLPLTSHNVSVVSLRSLQLTNVFSLPYGPTALVASADGRYLFAPVEKQDRLYVLDASTGRIVADCPVTGGPRAAALTADGRQLWLACGRTDTVCELDVSDPTHLDGAALKTVGDLRGHYPMTLSWSPDGLRLLVLCRDSSSISEIAALDQRVVSSVSTGGSRPVGWSMVPGRTNEVWVANAATHNACLLDLDNAGRVLQNVDLPNVPVAIQAIH